MRQSPKKRERKRLNLMRAGMKGKVPWTLKGLDQCMAHMATVRARLEKERRESAYEATPIALQFILQKYGRVRGAPHLSRMNAVIMFMNRFRKRLIKEKFLRVLPNGKDEVEEALLVALAKLPFAGKYGFTYKQVSKYIRNTLKPN